MSFLVGMLDRRGMPDADRLARAAEVHGGQARTLTEGALAVAWTSVAEPARDGRALCLVDGTLDTDPRIGPASPPPARGDEARAVLEAWQRSEGTLLAGMRGDLALLLWDGHSGALVRDHLGARTWVVHDDGSRLLFATEVVALLAALNRRPAPDAEAVAHWICMSGMPGVKTLYAGVERVPAGCLRPLDPARPAPARRWWRPRYRTPERVGTEEAAVRVRGALEVAVARRARSGEGEATSVQLSGGLDSSTVAGIAAASLPEGTRPTRSYSVVFPEYPSIDEDELIVEIARRTKVTGTRLAVRSGSVLQGVLPYLERWDLPPVSPNLFFWSPMLARAAADGTRVMLDGEGGDEVFGVPVYLLADKLRRGQPRAAAALVRQMPGGRPDLPRKTVWRFLKAYGVRGLAPARFHEISRGLRGPEKYLPEYALPSVVKAFGVSSHGGAWKRHGGPRWWAHYLDVTTRGMGPALGYDHIRRRAALAGIAPRHPIADPDVIETMLSLPPELSFDPRFARPLVREAIKGLVPEAVRTRKDKSSFDAIFHDSLAGADLPVLRGLVGDRDARVGAYVDSGKVRETLLDPEPPLAGSERQRWALYSWRLLTLESWLRRQEDPSEPRRSAEAIGLPQPDVGFVCAPVDA